VENDLSQLQEKQLVKLLKKHFSNIASDIAKEKAHADKQLEEFRAKKKELEQQEREYKTKQKSSSSSSGGGSVDNDALLGVERTLRDLHLKSRSIKKKEAETKKLYQCYLHRYHATDLRKTKAQEAQEAERELFRRTKTIMEASTPVPEIRRATGKDSGVLKEKEELTSFAAKGVTVVTPVVKQFDERVKTQSEESTTTPVVVTPEAGRMKRVGSSSGILSARVTPAGTFRRVQSSVGLKSAGVGGGAPGTPTRRRRSDGAIALRGLDVTDEAEKETPPKATVAKSPAADAVVGASTTAPPTPSLPSVSSTSSPTCTVNDDCDISFLSDSSKTLEQWFREGNTVTGYIDFDDNEDNNSEVSSLAQDEQSAIVAMEQVVEDMKKALLDLEQEKKDTEKWFRYWSEEHQRNYYYEVTSRKVSWELPPSGVYTDASSVGSGSVGGTGDDDSYASSTYHRGSVTLASIKEGAVSSAKIDVAPDNDNISYDRSSVGRDSVSSFQDYSYDRSSMAASQSQIDVEHAVSDFLHDTHASSSRRSRASLRKEQAQRRRRNRRKRAIRRLLWGVVVLGIGAVGYARRDYVHEVVKRLMTMEGREDEEEEVRAAGFGEDDAHPVAEVMLKSDDADAVVREEATKENESSDVMNAGGVTDWEMLNDESLEDTSKSSPSKNDNASMVSHDKENEELLSDENYEDNEREELSFVTANNNLPDEEPLPSQHGDIEYSDNNDGIIVSNLPNDEEQAALEEGIVDPTEKQGDGKAEHVEESAAVADDEEEEERLRSTESTSSNMDERGNEENDFSDDVDKEHTIEMEQETEIVSIASATNDHDDIVDNANDQNEVTPVNETLATATPDTPAVATSAIYPENDLSIDEGELITSGEGESVPSDEVEFGTGVEVTSAAGEDTDIETGVEAESITYDEAEMVTDDEMELTTDDEVELTTDDEAGSATDDEADSSTYDEADSATNDEGELTTGDEAGEETETATGLEAESATGDEADSAIGDEVDSAIDDEADSAIDDEAESATGDEAESATGDEVDSAIDDEADSAIDDEAESATGDEAESAISDETEFTTGEEAESVAVDERGSETVMTMDNEKLSDGVVSPVINLDEELLPDESAQREEMTHAITSHGDILMAQYEFQDDKKDTLPLVGTEQDTDNINDDTNGIKMTEGDAIDKNVGYGEEALLTDGNGMDSIHESEDGITATTIELLGDNEEHDDREGQVDHHDADTATTIGTTPIQDDNEDQSSTYTMPIDFLKHSHSIENTEIEEDEGHEQEEEQIEISNDMIVDDGIIKDNEMNLSEKEDETQQYSVVKNSIGEGRLEQEEGADDETILEVQNHDAKEVDDTLDNNHIDHYLSDYDINEGDGKEDDEEDILDLDNDKYQEYSSKNIDDFPEEIQDKSYPTSHEKANTYDTTVIFDKEQQIDIEKDDLNITNANNTSVDISTNTKIPMNKPIQPILKKYPSFHKIQSVSVQSVILKNQETVLATPNQETSSVSSISNNNHELSTTTVPSSPQIATDINGNEIYSSLIETFLRKLDNDAAGTLSALETIHNNDETETEDLAAIIEKLRQGPPEMNLPLSTLLRHIEALSSSVDDNNENVAMVDETKVTDHERQSNMTYESTRLSTLLERIDDLSSSEDSVSLEERLDKRPVRCFLPVIMRLFPKCRRLAEERPLFDLNELAQSMMQ